MELFLLIAVGPAAYLLYDVYRKDRLETEPEKLLKKLVGFGALSVVPAAILEVIGLRLISDMRDLLTYRLVSNFLIVALAEEGCKYAMLRRLTWKNDAFNCSYDGLLYAVYVSMGFAIIENILYMLSNGTGVGIVRALTAIPGHCFFGVFMGVLYSRAKREDYLGNPARSLQFSLLALAAAVLIHGMYDFLLSLESTEGLIAFAVLLVGLYVFGFRAVNRASAADMYILPREAEAAAEPRWTCPACGSENEGVLCTFCGWHVPKSGSTAVPREPGPRPPAADSLPVPAAGPKKLKGVAPWLPLIDIAVGLVLIFAAGALLMSATGADYHYQPSVIRIGGSRSNDGLREVLACCVGIAGLILSLIMPFWQMRRNYKKAAAADPAYRQTMAEYRERRTQLEQAEKDYTDRESEWNAWQSAVRRAEKKRAKSRKSAMGEERRS